MILTDVAIKRPVFAIVVNIMIMFLGLFGFMRLGVREYPNIDQPVISITTTYSGASPEIVETQITKIIEDAVAGIEGIDYLSSVSQRGRSSINVIFKASADIEAAANDVRDRIARAQRGMPDDADDPIIRKNDSDADPVITLSLSSDKLSAVELTSYAQSVLQTQIEVISGVASIGIVGSREPVMRIWLDPEKMAAYQLTITDIESALRKQNIEIPSGSIQSKTRDFSVLARTDLNTENDFAKLILRATSATTDVVTSNSAKIVYLRDVARVELGSEEDVNPRARYNGVSVVSLNVIKQASANPMEISSSVRDLLPKIQKNLPASMKIDIAVDAAPFIKASLNGVYSTIFEAMVIVALVIFFFLRNIRATLIPLVAVPISLIATLFLMYLLGYSINTLTLLAMVLAIGLVVDDAIVMLENIHRYIEDGMSPVAAAFKGAREIGFAIIAMTLTLAVVYMPLLFAQGNVGKLFIEFAMTLSCTVLVSGFTALTLSPMMCSRLLQRHKPEESGYLSKAIEKFLLNLTQTYSYLLALVLSMSKIMLMVVIGILVACFVLFRSLPNELAPTEDRGSLVLRATGQEGANVNYTDHYAKQIESTILENIPEVQGFLSVAGIDGSDAFGRITLNHWDERERSQFEIANNINQLLKRTAVGLSIFVNNPPSLGQGNSSRPVQVVLRSSIDYAALAQQSEQILQDLKNDSRLVMPEHNLRVNMPQLDVKVDRDRLALIGVDVDAVGYALETAFGGKTVTQFKVGSEQYDVKLQLDAQRRQQPTDLEAVFVRSHTNKMVPLSNLVNIEENISAQKLLHFNKLRSVTFSAAAAPNISQAAAIQIVEDTIRKHAPEASIDYTGSARELFATGYDIYLIFIMALVCIYLVLAAQFESWIDPFIILLTVPLACLGALLTMWVIGNSLNIYSQIGLITLVGIITKNGILIVEFANQLQEEGKSKLVAIKTACALRLRPILMTSLTMILGAIPLVIASGAGAESRSAIGWVILGGMLLGTLLTLFIIPVMYILIAKIKKKDTQYIEIMS